MKIARDRADVDEQRFKVRPAEVFVLAHGVRQRRRDQYIGGRCFKFRKHDEMMRLLAEPPFPRSSVGRFSLQRVSRWVDHMHD